jgi:hypothetical protein
MQAMISAVVKGPPRFPSLKLLAILRISYSEWIWNIKYAILYLYHAQVKFNKYFKYCKLFLQKKLYGINFILPISETDKDTKNIKYKNISDTLLTTIKNFKKHYAISLPNIISLTRTILDIQVVV